MLSQPLTLNESDDRGRGLAAVTPPPDLPLADDDDSTQTGVFSPALPWSSSFSSPASPPHWASSSSSPSSPLPPPHWTSSSSSPSSPPPHWASSSSSAASITPPPVAPPVCFTPSLSVLSPRSSSSPPVPQSLPPPPPPSVSSTHFSPVVPPHLSSPLPVAPPFLSSALSSNPPLFSYSCTPRMSLLTAPPPSPVFFTPPLSILSPCSSSSPCVPQSFLPPPVSSTVFSPLVPPPPHLSSPLPVAPPFLSLSVSSTPLPPLFSYSCSTPLMSLLTAPPPPVSAPTSSHFPPLSLSSPPAPPSSVSTPPTSSPVPPISSSPSPPPVLSHHPSSVHPPPSCSCFSLLPRLLSAHRMEVRRLLRGALASLGHRLDSLERRSRRKRRRRKGRQRGGEDEAACLAVPLVPPPLSGPANLPCNSASSCSPSPLPPVTCSSSSSSSSTDSEESTSSLASSFSQSEQKRRRRSRGEEEGESGRKWRKKNDGGRGGACSVLPVNAEEEEGEEEEKEHAGRFVGRMAVSFRGGGAEEEVPLTLHNFNHRKHRRREEGDTSQSEKAVSVVVRQNGYRAAQVLHSISRSSSQHALQRSQNLSQSDVFSVSSSHWCFSDFTPPLSLSSNHSAFCLWLSSSSFSPSHMLQLSAVAVETLKSLRVGACGSPLRPLKDWTAPPSLSSDHCYVQSPTPSPTFSARRQQKQRANQSARSLRLPRRRSLPLPPCSANGLSVSVPAGQSAASSEYLSTNGERVKRVSQIRIRRASPRETPLTPMGLPKVKRLKKKEFSLEEIYTNKNYKSPTTNRSLETIFEEPREKDGALLLIGQQRRRRLLLFPDFTQPRKRKRPQGAGLPVAMVPRKRAAARRHYHGDAGDDEADLDVMLVERLSALEDFLTRQGLDV